MHLKVAVITSPGLSTTAVSIPDLLGLFRILLTSPPKSKRAALYVTDGIYQTRIVA